MPSFLTWTLFRCQSAQEIVRYLKSEEEEEEVDDRCLVFRIATGGSTLYNIKAVLDFSDKEAWINPTYPRIDHPVFMIPKNGYSELIGVHELYFPFNARPEDRHGKTLGDFYTEHTDSIGSNKPLEQFATLRIMASTTDGVPVNASRYFPIFSGENGGNIVIEGEFQPTLLENKVFFKDHRRYHFKHFSEIRDPKMESTNNRADRGAHED